MAFNLNTHNFIQSQGEWMTIVDVEGNETEARIKLLPLESEEYRKAKREASKKLMKLTKGNPKPKEEDLLKLEDLTEELTISMLTAITVGIEGLTWDGETPVKVEEAAELYKAHKFIVTQANEFVAKSSNFITP